MFRKHRPPVGASPGTMLSSIDAQQTIVHIVDYTADTIAEYNVTDIESLADCLFSKCISWIDVQGLRDVDTIQRIGEIFNIHPLTMADIVNVPTRPKVEEYDNYLFLVTSLVEITEHPLIDQEQVSIVCGGNFVLTFQEWHGDVFEPIRKRLRGKSGQMRGAGADYLTYALLDAIIDGFYPVLERYGEHLESIETQVLNSPTTQTLNEVFTAKRTLMQLRRSIWPQREAISQLIRDGSKHMKKGVQIYMRDVYDHAVQALDVLENYRELSSSFVELYMSQMSNRMNEVMKVLTVISTIFIPLTFIAGVYGMNFHYMPELEHPYGYAFVWALMIAIALSMLMYFRRKGWLGGISSGSEK